MYLNIDEYYVTDPNKISDYRIAGPIMGAIEMGCKFSHYKELTRQCYFVISKSSELYKSKNSVEGLRWILSLQNVKLYVKLVD